MQKELEKDGTVLMEWVGPREVKIQQVGKLQE